MRNKLARKKWPALAVASCYLLALLIISSGVIYFQRNELSDAEACNKTCSFQHKSGQLEYVDSWERTAGMRSRGRQECRCH